MPNRDLTERVVTSPYLDHDHYESTHDECDNGSGTDFQRGFEVIMGKYLECSDLSGKTIQSLRIHQDAGDGTEIQIDLTDGTSFACCVSHSPNMTAFRYKGGVGTPTVLHKYEL
jgi:hypothetical protein